MEIQRSQDRPLTVRGQLRNISLAGYFAHVKVPCALKAGDAIISTVEIPHEQHSRFPFSRVVGKGWVVRLEPVPLGRRAGETLSATQLVGVAVAFASDVSALARVE